MSLKKQLEKRRRKSIFILGSPLEGRYPEPEEGVFYFKLSGYVPGSRAYVVIPDDLDGWQDYVLFNSIVNGSWVSIPYPAKYDGRPVKIRVRKSQPGAYYKPWEGRYYLLNNSVVSVYQEKDDCNAG